MDNKSYQKLLIETALDTGREVLKYYKQNYTTKYKKDNSPVTDADIKANDMIVKALKKTNLPIISEEFYNTDYKERKHFKELWIIDPIDGTRQFIYNEDEFTINIARVLNNKVVEGVVYAPALQVLYYGNVIEGIAEKYYYNQNKRISLPAYTTDTMTFVVSKSHLKPETVEYIEKVKKSIKNLKVLGVGSSLKICKLAEGSADYYPRYGIISEWDIAAGHAILKASNGNMIEHTNEKELSYNTENLRTKKFFAYRNIEVYKKITRIIDKHNSG